MYSYYHAGNAMRPLMLECSFREVRHCAAKLIERCFEHSRRHNRRSLCEPSDSGDSCKKLLSALVSLVEKDVATHYKNSSQLFGVLASYAKMVSFQDEPRVQADSLVSSVSYRGSGNASSCLS